MFDNIGIKSQQSADKPSRPSQPEEAPNPNPPPIDKPNERMLYFAEKGNTDEVRSLISEHGADVHFMRDMALFLAMRKGHTETVVTLVKEFGAVFSEVAELNMDRRIASKPKPLRLSNLFGLFK
jgi:hypothetical protein